MLASPANFIDPTDPPFLIIHGALDKVVPLKQSTSFEKLLKKENVSAELIILPDAGHGGKQFATKELTTRINQFFDQHISQKK